MLANSSTPIILPSRPFHPVRGNLEVAERNAVEEGTDMSAFVHSNVQISLRSIAYHNSRCGGEFCDRQAIVQNGVVANRCACFQTNRQRNGCVVVIITFVFTREDGTEFIAELSSKWFLDNFVFNGAIPSGTRARHLEEFDVDERINTAVVDMLDCINSRGGFKIFGWTKRGEIQDQAVDQPGNGLPHNAPQNMIEAGELVFHVTRVEPVRPEDIDLNILEGFRVNVATDLTP